MAERRRRPWAAVIVAVVALVLTAFLAFLTLASLGAALACSGCLYSFRAGSFPPPHIKTIAVAPFENETTRFELSGELYDQLFRNLPRALGIRTAGEDVADAVVRGTIVRYDVVAPNYRAGAEGHGHSGRAGSAVGAGDFSRVTGNGRFRHREAPRRQPAEGLLAARGGQCKRAQIAAE